MINDFSEITKCEVCGNKELESVLNLGLHPMCDDLVAINDSRVCKEYPIEILFCNTCLTAHQKYQVPKGELFPKSYHYRSRFTADVLNGMKGLVSSCEEQFGSLAHKKVIDIGCNDGSLLNFFREKGADTYGIEPTGAYMDAIDNGHIVLNNFLSIETAAEIVSNYGKPDFICFTNVFAHIENLKEVIDSLKHLIHSKSIIVIENHYLGAVIAGNQFDTFYHEHPRTYSYKSFVYIAKALGLDLLSVNFPSRYGGNIRVCMGNPEVYTKIESGNTENISREVDFLKDFQKMKSGIDNWLMSKKKFIGDYVNKHGKIRAKAFPGRAAILVKMLGLTEKEILGAYEKPGSMKIGNYIPGTKIPIFSDDGLFAEKDKDKPILNFAWHIHDEIKTYLEANGYKGEIIDILSADDFKDK